jgi:DNA polymerase-3 subunit delta
MAADLSDLKPVYLIYGSEELLLERAVRRLRERLASVADLDFNMETFDGDSAGADEIINAANTMPFMSERRLVIVRGVDKMAAAEQGLLADYAKDPAPFTALVLVATKVNRGSRLYKAVDALKGAAEYAAPKRGEYPAEVTRLFAEHGKQAASDAARALVDAVGRDLRRLDTEVDKLVAYVGDRDRVTAADVAAVVTAGAVTVFEFTDAIGSRDTGVAVAKLRRLLAAGESVHGLLAMAVRHVRSLLGARALMDRRVRTDEMAPLLGMAPWLVRNTVSQAANFEPAELSRALRDAATAEAQLKSGAVDGAVVLERWVVSVAHGGPRLTARR